MILWLTGRSPFECDRVANMLKDAIDCIHISDGLLQEWLPEEDNDGRCLFAAHIANTLCSIAPVIISATADTISVRHYIAEICNPIWIFVQSVIINYQYEEPAKKQSDTLGYDMVTLNIEKLSANEIVKRICHYTGLAFKESFITFIGKFHNINNDIFKEIKRALATRKPVLVAIENDARTFDRTWLPLSQRLSLFKREFGDSIKLISIPPVEDIRRME